MSRTPMTPDTLRAQAHVMKEDFPVISDGAIEGLMMIADVWQAQVATLQAKVEAWKEYATVLYLWSMQTEVSPSESIEESLSHLLTARKRLIELGEKP